MNTRTLKTPYSKIMNKKCPHDYYPRPQMKRDSFYCLNGEWDFTVNDCNSTDSYDKKILVPFCPESSLSGVERITEKYDFLHYRKYFSLPLGFIKDRVFLHFGAVDQECTVYINDIYVGENKGGYLPFSIDITLAVCDGENEIKLCVRDMLDKTYPYGKQKYNRGGMWYTPISGIWQSVWIESVPHNYIKSLKITPLSDGVTINIQGGETKKHLKLDNGDEFDFWGDEITVKPSNLKLWSPEEPNLYYFTLTSGTDTVTSYFAVRYIDIRDIDGVKKICLNGSPYIFNGVLDQGYYPDGIYLPADIEAYRDDIRRMKAMGFNMLRKHIKIEPLIFYHICDTEGIAVFQDMVNNSHYSFILDTVLPTIGLQKLPDALRFRSQKSKMLFELCMIKTVNLLYNIPSIVYYTIFNEGWGQFSTDKMYEIMKEIDETRIIDSTSGWFRRYKSDVDSRHIYFKPLSVKKPNGAPIVISEFGGYSFRVEEHLFGEKNYGYRVFENKDDYEDAIIALYENEVLPMAQNGVSAFVLTQLSDVEDETNGLITYDRKVVKVSSDRMRKVMDKLN